MSIRRHRNSNHGEQPKDEFLPAGDLVIDPVVQRPPSQTHVDEIAKSFNWGKFGTLLVSRRPNGECAVLNGQHRLLGLRQAGLGHSRVKCEVHEGLTVAQEADLFNGHNTTRKPSAFDKFEKGVLAEDARYVSIHNVLQKHGLRIVRGGTHEGRGVRAVGAVERVYDMREGMLELVCAIATEAWPMNPDATDGKMLSGLGIFLDTYWDEVNTDSLTKKLSKYPGGPGLLIANSVGQMAVMRTHSKAVAELIRQVYNKGLSAKSKLGTS